jgi:hypothetical protein
MEPGKRFSQMMQLAAQVGERLGVCGLRPERAANTLSWDGATAAVKDEKGDELLLSWTRRPGRRVAVEEDPKPPEDIDTQPRRTRHASRLPEAPHGRSAGRTFFRK